MDSQMRSVPSMNWNRTTLWQVGCGDPGDTSLWRGWWYGPDSPFLRATPDTEEDET